MMEASHSWDGTLTLDDFNVAAKALLNRWKDINHALPSWTWVPCTRLPCGVSRQEDGYLALDNVYHLMFNEENCSQGSLSVEDEPLDKATLVQTHDQETFMYDFHVVYSTSYQVPVLYFRGRRSDGQPLELGEIERDLPSASSKVLRDAKWTFMTQEEHPYLNRPWFMLHPCGTSNWMKLLFEGNCSGKKVVLQEYLLAWLSVVGQAVGLRISSEMLNSPHC